MKVVTIKKNERHFTLTIKVFGLMLFDRKWSEDGNRLELKIAGLPVYIPTHYLKETFVKTAYEAYLNLMKRGIVSRGKATRLRIENVEKCLIEESGYWDALWYVNKYGYSGMTRQQALDNWYRKGWRKGEDPSPIFHTRSFAYIKSWQNPILVHLERLTALPTAVNNVYKSSDDARTIEDYWRHYDCRQSKSVVYTCITNGYDDIHEIETYHYVDKDWDYVCFSDDEALIAKKRVGIWQIRKLAFSAKDSTRNGRWHKTHPHVILPEYDESIYIDGNINILSDYLFRQIRRIDKPIIVPQHQYNLCLYSEYRDVLAAELDDAAVISEEEAFVRGEGMPENYGFLETNIFYRRHNDAVVKKVMDEWWGMIERFSKRDQLSITYALWKNGIPIDGMTLGNARFLSKDFLVFPHIHYK